MQTDLFPAITPWYAIPAKPRGPRIRVSVGKSLGEWTATLWCDDVRVARSTGHVSELSANRAGDALRARSKELTAAAQRSGQTQAFAA